MSDKPKPSSDDIENMVKVTTRRQRGFGIYLMNEESRSSGNPPLKLSYWTDWHLSAPEINPRAESQTRANNDFDI